MEIWLAIFLFMSIALNIILSKAYIKQNVEYKEVMKLYEELEKTRDHLEKSMTKMKNVKAQSFLAGRFGVKRGK